MASVMGIEVLREILSDLGIESVGLRVNKQNVSGNQINQRLTGQYQVTDLCISDPTGGSGYQYLMKGTEAFVSSRVLESHVQLPANQCKISDLLGSLGVGASWSTIAMTSLLIESIIFALTGSR